MSNSKLLLAVVTLCTACGSSFEAGGSGGAGGSAANAGAPGSDGGDTSSAGASSAGAPGAGASSAGAANAGSGGAASGGAPTGGAGGSSAGAGGRAGGGSAGVGGSADCATLKAEYTAALDKARVCDKGSTNQCDPSSTLPAIGCGCPVLVNAKSEATTTAKQKYQAYQDAKCSVGPICNIACLAYSSAMCSQQTMGSGNVFVCTGSQGVITN